MAKNSSKGKLGLSNELRALDRKDRQFRQSLTDEERKKFSTYLMMRYSACVEGSADLQAYYLMAANENVNKNFFTLKDHPELQWLCCTTVSPGLGTHRHYWLNPKKNSAGEAAGLRKYLLELLPLWKTQDIDLLLSTNSVEELTEWIQQHGVEVKL